jgi:hypothetical protein
MNQAEKTADLPQIPSRAIRLDRWLRQQVIRRMQVIETRPVAD